MIDPGDYLQMVELALISSSIVAEYRIIFGILQEKLEPAGKER